MWQYKASLVRVIDGDTVVVDVDLGFSVSTRQTLRLMGIDAPEMRGADKPRGEAARDALVLLLRGEEMIVETEKDKKGKYGRYLARMLVDGTDVNQRLVDSGHAVLR